MDKDCVHEPTTKQMEKVNQGQLQVQDDDFPEVIAGPSRPAPGAGPGADPDAGAGAGAGAGPGTAGKKVHFSAAEKKKEKRKRQKANAKAKAKAASASSSSSSMPGQEQPAVPGPSSTPPPAGFGFLGDLGPSEPISGGFAAAEEAAAPHGGNNNNNNNAGDFFSNEYGMGQPELDQAYGAPLNTAGELLDLLEASRGGVEPVEARDRAWSTLGWDDFDIEPGMPADAAGDDGDALFEELVAQYRQQESGEATGASKKKAAGGPKNQQGGLATRSSFQTNPSAEAWGASHAVATGSQGPAFPLRTQQQGGLSAKAAGKQPATQPAFGQHPSSSSSGQGGLSAKAAGKRPATQPAFGQPVSGKQSFQGGGFATSSSGSMYQAAQPAHWAEALGQASGQAQPVYRAGGASATAAAEDDDQPRAGPSKPPSGQFHPAGYDSSITLSNPHPFLQLQANDHFSQQTELAAPRATNNSTIETQSEVAFTASSHIEAPRPFPHQHQQKSVQPASSFAITNMSSSSAASDAKSPDGQIFEPGTLPYQYSCDKLYFMLRKARSEYIKAHMGDLLTTEERMDLGGIVDAARQSALEKWEAVNEEQQRQQSFIHDVDGYTFLRSWKPE